MIDREKLARILATVTYTGGAPAAWGELMEPTRLWHLRQADAAIAYVASTKAHEPDARQGTSSGNDARGAP